MFTIFDGRKDFFQWDLNQKVIVSEKVDRVHFAINGRIEATEVKEVEGQNVADVPNIVLQSAGQLIVYAYIMGEGDEETITKVQECFWIKGRPKPPDYVYTETEVLSYETIRKELAEIEKRLKKVEETGGGGTGASGGYYIPHVSENGVLSWTATEETMPPVPSADITGPEGKPGKDGKPGYTPQKGVDYFDGKTPNIQIGEVITLEPGAEATASITGTAEEPRLNLGIPKGDPGEGGGNAEVTAENIEKALGYIPANPKDLPTVPTNVSAFNNDAGYAKKTELPKNTSDLTNDSGFITAKDIPAAPEVPVKSVFGRTGAVVAQSGDYTAEMVGARPNTWTPTAEEVSADKAGTAAEKVGDHNADTMAHPYIQALILKIENWITAFDNTDEETLDQLSEIVAYIKSNKSLIDEITTSKVSVADIVNNLATNVANKPLSAAQGVVLKGLVDSLTTVANNATTTAGNAATTANEAKSLANTANTNAKNAVDTVNNMQERMDSGEFKGDTGDIGPTGPQGIQGTPGADGVSIVSVEQTTTSSADGGENVVTVTLSNGVKSTFKIKNGSKGSAGEKGNGIKSAVLNADYTLTLTFDDGTEYTTPSIRGAQGPKGDTYELTEADKEEIAGMVGSPVLPDYWEEYLPNKIALIKAKQDEGGKDCFSFVVMTDIHYPANLGKRSPAIAKRLLEECDIRFTLCLGDKQTRSCYDTKEQILTENEAIEEMFAPIRKKLLETEGNHDGAYGKFDKDGDGTISNNNADGSVKDPADRETYVYNLTPAELHSTIYRKVGLVGDVYFDESGSGYYIDDTANKVRYIILNTQCNDYELQADGTVKYPKMWLMRFTQPQFDLVIEALNSIPSDSWGVVVAGHCPITQEIGDREVMQGVLNAYKNKTAYTGEYAGTAEGGASYKNLAEPLPNNTTDTTKWVNGYRISSSGMSALSGKTVCNPIDVTVGDVIRVKGVAFESNVDRYGSWQTNGAWLGNGAGYVSAGSTSVIGINVVGDVYEFTVLNANVATMRFAFTTPTDPSGIVITKNEEIVEGGAPGYDAVSVDCDFSNAKGELVGYFAGHLHVDSNTTANGVPVITTRCDGREENTDALKNERVEGTITEQSFDVFTVNKATRKIYATKIGAGSDREITY